jgi:hypothetical protein
VKSRNGGERDGRVEKRWEVERWESGCVLCGPLVDALTR